MFDIRGLKFTSLLSILQSTEHISCFEWSSKLLTQDTLSFLLTADDALESALDRFADVSSAVGICGSEHPAFESTYQGATYLFASSADKADFEKDPAKYAPRYGGFCSYGVTIGVLADLEGPDAFAVYKGKLYLCGNQGALKEFKTNIDDNIEKADTNWRTLAGP